MGNRQQLRAAETRQLDTFDDQKTAAEILNAEATSTTLEQLFNFVLSQLKRFLHGNRTGNWRADPASAFGGDASLHNLFIETNVDAMLTDEDAAVLVDEDGNVLIED